MKNKLRLIQDQIDAVKSIMVSNIEKSLRNTESLESLNEKAERLAEQAKVFKKTSRKLNQTVFFVANKTLIKLIAFTLTMALLGVVGLLGGLQLISASTSFLLALSIASLGLAVIAGTELAVKLIDKGLFKNPFHFFGRKNGRDEGHQVPSQRPEMN
jgi:hypothetical protein